MRHFEPTLHAARHRLDSVRPDCYARTRNALDGAVTGLSPYITHGFLSLSDVHTAVHARHGLHPKHKLVFELGWRAYYRHVWAHLGEGIGQSLHAGPLPDSAYKQCLPPDVLEARTGIPAIDLAVRELYETGYVHNHARMWLASYLVHLRKVHWHAGAQWMLGHLLDGDHASNHLSWQWVAGTGSSKPYLFNADNVAKFAPPSWHSEGTAIDLSYEAMDALARGSEPLAPSPNTHLAHAGVPEPKLFASPIAIGLNAALSEPWRLPDATTMQHLAGRDVWLHHPWSLGEGPATLLAKVLHVGVGIDSCHAKMPWSQRRWGFVTRGLMECSDRALPLCWGTAQQIAHALQSAASVHWQPDPHVDVALGSVQALLLEAKPQRAVGPLAELGLFEPVSVYCRSFSEWWKRTSLRYAHSPERI